MSSFSDKEIEYLNSQRLGRLATLSADGSPHLTVARFRYNPELDTIDIGGHNMGQSKKYRDVIRDGRVAFAVDDSAVSWPRGIEIRGQAEALGSSEAIMPGFVSEVIRIHPTHIVGWGIESEAYNPNSRKVVSLSHLDGWAVACSGATRCIDRGKRLQKPKFIEKLLVDHWNTVQEVSPPLRRFPEGETWRRTPKLLKLRRYLNARRAIGAMKRGAGHLSSYPTYLTIDPFSACNLKCPLCPTGNGRITLKKGRLQTEMFRHIVDEMGTYLYSIDMFNWGEPLLNKDIYAMIDYAHQRHIITSVSSNFHYFDAQAAELMIKSGLDYLILSIDGATQSTFEQYRVGGNLETVLRNVRTLTDTRKQLGSRTPYIFWQYLVFRHNEYEIEQARALAAELGVDEFKTELAYLEVDTREKGERWIPRQPQYSRYNLVELDALWSAQEEKQAAALEIAANTMPERGQSAALDLLPARPQANPAKPLRRRLPDCIWLYTTAVVNADGSIAPCCAVEKKEDRIGTLQGGGTIGGIWNSKEYQAARLYSTRGAESGVETVCHHCVLAPADGENR